MALNNIQELFEKLYGRVKRDKPIVYLAGPMDSLPDAGATWRRIAANAISKLGMYSINPCELESALANQRAPGAGTVQDMRTRGDWIAVEEHMGPNIDIDLYAVSISDALLLRWNGEAMCGSIGEATLAYYMRIPIYMATTVATQDTPAWLLGCCGGHRFPTVAAALIQLRLDLEKIFG